MEKLICIIWFLLFNSTDAKTKDIGIGILEVDVDSISILGFYNDTLSVYPDKTISFFFDTTINSIAIKNHNSINWLKPEILHLDYSRFHLRVNRISGNWYEIIANRNTGYKYWVKKKTNVHFYSWEIYFKQALYIERTSKNLNPIRKAPSYKSKKVLFNGKECYHVKDLKGDWIKIANCDNTKILGWILWRDNKDILINYFLME